MLDDDHRVADVAQVRQRAEQALIVALVQADRRLVEDVHDADQAGADLAGQPDTLRFAARQRVGAAVERQVVEPDVDRKPSRSPISLTILSAIVARQPSSCSVSKNSRACRPTARDLGQRAVADEHVAGRSVQPRALAVGAGLAVQELRELLAHGAGLGFAVAALEIREHAFEAVLLLDLHAARVVVEELDLLLAAAVQDDVCSFFGSSSNGVSMSKS